MQVGVRGSPDVRAIIDLVFWALGPASFAKVAVWTGRPHQGYPNHENHIQKHDLEYEHI